MVGVNVQVQPFFLAIIAFLSAEMSKLSESGNGVDP
jgi:hypothetical protein